MSRAERELFVCVKQAVAVEGTLALAPGEKMLVTEGSASASSSIRAIQDGPPT